MKKKSAKASRAKIEVKDLKPRNSAFVVGGSPSKKKKRVTA